MKTKSYSLPISLIRQFLFCPRIPFYLEVLGICSEAPIWVKQGVDEHTRQTMLEKRRQLSRFGIKSGKTHFSKELKSSTYGLHGIVDMLIETDSNVVIVEFKPNTNQIQKAHIYQAVAYGLLAEEYFQKPLSSVFILYGDRGKVKPMQQLEDIRSETISMIERLHMVINSSMLPFSDAKANKCGQCEYVNFCNDRNLEYEYK
jgi:CRISPR-associated exonuclease Cas4